LSWCRNGVTGMLAYEIVRKKLDGEANSEGEIRALVDGFVRGEIAPEQMAAWLAAVYVRGLSDEEIWWLTKAMAESGRMLDLSAIDGIKVDKHSTGGVGDKVSIVAVPLVAAGGVPVAKLTGRALGHTGGTADKLESIPGMRLDLSEAEFIGQVQRIGCAIAVATEDIAPADKKIYALRDKTATIASIPLIVSSILSKKLAGGADAFVFDVKFGDGAFMRQLEEAKALAEGLVRTAKLAGKRAVAVLSSMEQPLGHAVGNAVEVAEAIAVLRGEGPTDVREVCLTVAAHMLWLGGVVSDPQEGRRKAEELLGSGAALEKFRQLVAAQGAMRASWTTPSGCLSRTIGRRCGRSGKAWSPKLPRAAWGFWRRGWGRGDWAPRAWTQRRGFGCTKKSAILCRRARCWRRCKVPAPLRRSWWRKGRRVLGLGRKRLPCRWWRG